MIFIMVIIFNMGTGFAGSPMIPIAITAEFNNQQACRDAIQKLQSFQPAKEAYCLPKGEKK